MFPHSSSDQTQSPFIYTSSPILEMKPLANDEKTSSGQDQDQHASSYSHLSAPFFEDDELFFTHFLSQQKLFVGGSNSQVETENSVAATHKATDNRKEECSNTVAEQIPSKRTFPNKKIIGGAKSTGPRKRTGKKDRHSKICTAQGPRDRRMRLSLQIAREFFDLQDMLGFDKASKTIEWLFSKSRTAITELTESISHVKQTCSDDAAKSVSVTSDSEVVSENHGEIASDGDQRGFGADAESFNRMKTDRKLNIVARDSRNKARARARERTRKKMMIRGHELSKEISDSVVPNPNSNLVQLCSSSPLETGDQESCFRSNDMKTSQKMVAEVEERCSHLLEHQIDSVSINGNFLGIVGAPTSSNLVLNHSPNDLAASSGENTEEDFPGFPVNFSSNNNNNNANMRPFCCTTSTNTKSSTENVQLRIPSAMGASLKSHELKQTSIFMTTYNTQEQMLNSIFRSTPNIQDQNRSSIFITSLNTQRQNPTTNFLATSINNNSLHSQFLGNEFS